MKQNNKEKLSEDRIVRELVDDELVRISGGITEQEVINNYRQLLIDDAKSRNRNRMDIKELEERILQENLNKKY